MRQKMYDLLSEEFEYFASGRISSLVYPSGSGGEFFTIMISKYSTDDYYRPKYTYVPWLNRYKIHDNSLYGMYEHNIISEFNVKFDINEILDRVDCSILTADNYGRHISHVRNGGKFLNKGHKFIREFMPEEFTFAISLDTKDMFIYSAALSSIKICLDRMSINEIKYSLWYIDKQIRDSILGRLESEGRPGIEYSRISTYMFKGVPLNDALNMPIEEIIKIHYESRESVYTNNIKNFENRMNMLNMSEIMQTNILSDIFKFSDPDKFAVELDMWDQKNMELINQYGKNII